MSWLGVVVYLTREAIIQTLRDLPLRHLAVEYSQPAENADEDARQLAAAIQARMREVGEPWITLLSPTQFAAMLTEAGFTVIEDVGKHDIHGRYGLPALSMTRMALARKE